MPAFAEQRVDAAGREAGDALEVEAREGAAERLALAEDGQPAQARLEPFEADLLEQAVVVGDRPAPLGVVVRAVLVRRRAPPAPRQTIGTGDDTIGERWHGGHHIRELAAQLRWSCLIVLRLVG